MAADIGPKIGIDGEKDSNAIVSYVENQLRSAEKIPCLFA